jgi:hypothetical protein
MYNDSLIQALYGIVNGSNAPAIKRQYIGNFESFILNHIPYAEVRDRDLQTGLISFDGPGANGFDEQRPILVWHFAGLPYPIVRAAMIDYSYLRTWDGTNVRVYASMVFGFQDGVDHALVPSPRTSVLQQGFARGMAQQEFVDLFTQTVTTLSNNIPTATVSGTTAYTNLHDFVLNEIGTSYPDGLVALPPPQGNGAAEAHAAAANGATAPQPHTIEFDGPARDHDSHHIFAYTLETLFNNQDLFNQILWWYFGGQPVRITKAMRIPLADGGPSLFVGYSGPGGVP